MVLARSWPRAMRLPAIVNVLSVMMIGVMSRGSRTVVRTVSIREPAAHVFSVSQHSHLRTASQRTSSSSDAMLPIVFVHLGPCDEYARLAIQVAAERNADVRVLCDGECPVSGSVKVFAIKRSERADTFSTRFQGGTNGREFELRCFVRFFHLLEHMVLTATPHVLYADSDVLITWNLAFLAEGLHPSASALMWLPPRVSASTAFFTQRALEDIVSFFEHVVHVGVWATHPDRVNDMQALRLYVYKGRPSPWACWGIAKQPGQCQDTTLLRQEDLRRVSRIPSFGSEVRSLGDPMPLLSAEARQWLVFDNNFDHDPERKYGKCGSASTLSENGGKAVRFANGSAFFERTDKGQVRAGGIHFQGWKKGWLKNYALLSMQRATCTCRNCECSECGAW